MLVSGCWFLDASFWMLVSGCWFLDAQDDPPSHILLLHTPKLSPFSKAPSDKKRGPSWTILFSYSGAGALARQPMLVAKVISSCRGRSGRVVDAVLVAVVRK